MKERSLSPVIRLPGIVRKIPRLDSVYNASECTKKEKDDIEKHYRAKAMVIMLTVMGQIGVFLQLLGIEISCVPLTIREIQGFSRK